MLDCTTITCTYTLTKVSCKAKLPLLTLTLSLLSLTVTLLALSYHPALLPMLLYPAFYLLLHRHLRAGIVPNASLSFGIAVVSCDLLHVNIFASTCACSYLTVETVSCWSSWTCQFLFVYFRLLFWAWAYQFGHACIQIRDLSPCGFVNIYQLELSN